MTSVGSPGRTPSYRVFPFVLSVDRIINIGQVYGAVICKLLDIDHSYIHTAIMSLPSTASTNSTFESESDAGDKSLLESSGNSSLDRKTLTGWEIALLEQQATYPFFGRLLSTTEDEVYIVR